MTAMSSMVLLFLLVGVIGVQADCGCGMRCQKYTNELQCARCCTATVRRSVPLIPDDEEDNSIQQQLQETRKRSLAELSSILSLLEQKERRASSKKVRTELHKARQRLERYGQIRYGDLLEETYDLPSDRPPLNKDEEEMYGMLERILRRLVQKHQIEEDSPIPINKRSVETIQRTLEQQQPSSNL